MRDYAKVAPQFWTGDTGKRLKAAGPEAVIVAMYLMTSPHANMIGLFYLPKIYLAHETGLGLEGACKGLARAIEAGFCTYDDASEYVFVHAMARFQIADALKAGDKRIKGVENEIAKAPKGALRRAFLDLYGKPFRLGDIEPEVSPFEAPSKPLRSQEQEQEQEQEKDHEPANAGLSPDTGDEGPAACPQKAIIALYHEILPEFRRVREWNETRQRLLTRRWREARERQSLAWWRTFFGYVRRSRFLMGQTTGRDGRPFDCDLEWLIRPTNFAKVIEGKYEDEAA